jgi:hypothetical protein
MIKVSDYQDAFFDNSGTFTISKTAGVQARAITRARHFAAAYINNSHLVIDLSEARAAFCDLYDIRGRRMHRIVAAGGASAHRIAFTNAAARMVVFRDARGNALHTVRALSTR